MHINGQLKRLTWDSDFFRINTGLLLLGDGSALENDLSSYDLVQVKVSSTEDETILNLQRVGFTFVEGDVVFKSVLTGRSIDSQWRRHTAEEECLDTLRDIARKSFTVSRFREPWFRSADREEFYSVWVENAVNGSFDDICLIVKLDSIIAGFVTVKVTGSDARIGLIAVDAEFRGKGVASMLMRLAESYSVAQGASVLHVATQIRNLGAMSLYAAAGYSIVETNYWFYRGRL
jgi:dTDP-4-amino-4,6-dideoxy-D-galactose acyltransferase